MNKTETAANRGKYAEKKVKEYLEKMSAEYVWFDFKRNMDARSSRGKSAQPQTGDFDLYWPECFAPLEVKQVDHEYRLPNKNFGPGEIPRLKKRELAGGRPLVWVYHTPTELWRTVPFSFIYDNKDLPSWDLSEFSTFPKCSDLLIFKDRWVRCCP